MNERLETTQTIEGIGDTEIREADVGITEALKDLGDTLKDAFGGIAPTEAQVRTLMESFEK